ncbi:MAG: hypothetical protein QM601_06555 [Pseudoxanthomonas sp.]
MSVSRLARPLAPALLALAVLSVSGCFWFHKGPRGDYLLSEQERPLEVPPDLNQPNTAGAMQVPSTATGATATPAQASSTFAVAGSRDEVFTKLGTSLGGIDGATVTSQAQLLGTYEVSYQGASFLLRVTAAEAGGATVSAVDARGLPANGPEVTRLMATLKNRLGGK